MAVRRVAVVVAARPCRARTGACARRGVRCDVPPAQRPGTGDPVFAGADTAATGRTGGPASAGRRGPRPALPRAVLRLGVRGCQGATGLRRGWPGAGTDRKRVV